MEATAIVLAGGKSLRLGRNKVLETILGKSLIEHVVDRLRPLVSQLLIVTSKEQLTLPSLEQAEILIDLYPDKGPLAGIYTGLLAARYSQSVVVGCDMPFLNTELLRFMAELSYGFDAVVPRLSQAMVEPLHAIYVRSCLGKIKTQLEQNQLDVGLLVAAVHARYVERKECQRFDPQLLSFLNINSQSDLDRAIALATKDRGEAP